MNNSFFHRTTTSLVLVVICGIAFASTSMAADWSQFRGPSSYGTSNDTKIPTEWDDTKNLKWKVKLPGAGFSSPIVVGDNVFVTCFSNARDLSNLKRHLVCVDRNKGKVIWAKVIPSDAPERRETSFGSHGYASHTPVSDGETIYVLFGNSGVMAFDMKGNRLWRQKVGQESASRFGSAASPILYKDKLIVTAASESESIRALDKKTGKELWKTEAGSLSRTYCTPVIAKNAKGEDELLISVAYEVWSLNPDTGKLKWYAETKVDTNACPSLVTHNNIAYVIGGRSPGGRAAIELGGKDDVSKTNVKWSLTGGSYVPSPIFFKNHLYWVNDRGIAYCINAKTGEEAGRKRLGGQFYASVVLVGDKIYAVSRFSGTHVLKATPKLTEIAYNKLDDSSDFSGSPVASNGQLIFRSNTNLYCVSASP